MVRLRITPWYCLAYYFLIMLHSSMHELLHHFVGFAVCGQWGTKTFNSFQTACEDNPISHVATYAGPAYSYLMMWVGSLWLSQGRSPWQEHLGFATIFAQLPLQRMTGPLFGWNDEWYSTSILLGNNEVNRWVTFGVLLAITIPVLVVAYRAIQNRWRWVWFLFYLVLFPYLLWGPVFAGLEYVMVGLGFLAQPIIGIGLLFIVNELITVLGWLLTQRHIDPDAATGSART